jgi:hypothetical protein
MVKFSDDLGIDADHSKYALQSACLVRSVWCSRVQSGFGSTRRYSCAICLSDYEKGQGIRFLPCKHHFHAECVDKYIMPSSSQTSSTLAHCLSLSLSVCVSGGYSQTSRVHSASNASTRSRLPRPSRLPLPLLRPHLLHPDRPSRLPIPSPTSRWARCDVANPTSARRLLPLTTCS